MVSQSVGKRSCFSETQTKLLGVKCHDLQFTSVILQHSPGQANVVKYYQLLNLLDDSLYFYFYLFVCLKIFILKVKKVKWKHTKVLCYVSLIRWARTNRCGPIPVWQGCGEKHSYVAGESRKAVWQDWSEFHMHILLNSVMPLLGIYSTDEHTITYITRLFIAYLKKQKFENPKCPPTGD